MANLVEVIGVTHNPSLPRIIGDPNPDNHEANDIRMRFQALQKKVDEAKPDVLICIGNDHLNKLFMDNMPAFLVGKSPTAEGPFNWELQMGMPAYKTTVDVDVAKSIVRGGFDHRVDFAYSDDFKIDHSHTIPLTFLRPEQDIPIVPIFCNVMAPPIPPARRFYEVGEALRDIIEEMPSSTRVVALCSGHLSVEIGGPRSLGGGANVDSEFDEWSVDLVGRGDVEAVCRDLTFDRMWQAGNYTAGFLTFVMLLGLARGKPATKFELLPCRAGAVPFFDWEIDGKREKP